MTTGTITPFFHFVVEEKKNKKTKAFYDWAITGIQVKTGINLKKH